MAMIDKVLLESVRAATLGCHSAAGMSTSLRGKGKSSPQCSWLPEVARLLRGAEALCRSAVALIEKGKH
eukprot:3964131-Karenia_brevis.AAC.1